MDRRDGKSQHHPQPDPVQKFEMMQEIWRLKGEFWTYEEIGEELGIAPSTAWRYFHEYELYLVPPNVEQERLMHIKQLQAMMSRAHKLLERAGDVETTLKVLAEIRNWMKQYAHFMGMNAPDKISIRTTTQFDEDVQGLLAEFGEFHDKAERIAEKERAYRKGRVRR